jgi:hypothetical protein
MELDEQHYPLERTPHSSQVPELDITEITSEQDKGYDGDNENEQLPDSISEPATPASSDEDEDSSADTDLQNMPYDEATLIKGFRNLDTSQFAQQTAKSRKLKPPPTLKRSHSQMRSDSDSEDYHYVFPPSRQSRAGTPTVGKRREFRRLKAVVGGGSAGQGGQMHKNGRLQAGYHEDAMLESWDDAMDIDVDLLSSPVPRSEPS